MRFSTSFTLSLLGYSSFARIGLASPTNTINEAIGVSFLQVPSDIDFNSTFGWVSKESHAKLEARSRPKECWQWVKGISGTKEEYKEDLAKLRSGLDASEGYVMLPPLSTSKATVGTATVTVRNQDSCVTTNLKHSVIAYYIKQIEDYCHEHSGWTSKTGDKQLVVIAEANGVAPPAYSPRCNYY